MKKRLAVAFSTLAVVAAFAPAAVADPDFGPGNSSKGPHDPGAKCHPPGQTVNTPGCK